MPRWGADTPIVGRDQELGRLIDVVARAGDGRPGAVLLGGEAGVGKSRLIEELTARAGQTGTLVLTGHCVDVGGGLPYLPFREAVSGLAGADGLFHDQRGGGDGVDQVLVFERVLDAVAASAVERAVLVVIEDLHWADSASRTLLRYLLTRLRDQRIAVVASYRTDELHRTHPLRPLLAELARLPVVERLTLDPLTDDQVRALLRLLRADASPSVVEGIVRQVDGNAFYAEEFLASCAERADLTAPAELTDLLLTRIEQLTPEGQQVLRAASVAGRTVPYVELLAAAGLPEPDLEAALRDITGRHLMHGQDDGSYTFRHALMQEAAYRDLVPGERARLHARYAGLIAERRPGPASAAERAHHLKLSSNLPEALSASYDAAGFAGRSGAPAVQLRHLETVLAMWDAVPDASERVGMSEAALILTAVAAASHAGEFARSEALAESALRLAEAGGDQDMIARACAAVAEVLTELDRDEEAYVYSRRASDLTRGGGGETRLAALAGHARVSLYLGRYDESDAAVEEALELAKALARPDFEADIAVTMLSGGALSDQTNRQTGEGVEALERALRLAREAGRPHIELRVLFNLAIGRYEAGDLVAAGEWAAIGVSLADRLGARASPYGGGLRGVEMLTRYLRGDWTGLVDRSIDLIEVPTAGYVLAAGDDDSWVEPAIRRLEQPGIHRPWMATLHLGSAILEHYVWAGDLDAAETWHQRVVDAVTSEFHAEPKVRLAATLLGLVADCALVRPDEPALRARADELIEIARTSIPAHSRWMSDGPEAMAWQALAEAEHARVSDVDAVVAWRAAYDAFDFGDVYHQAICRWRLAEQLVIAGDKQAAKSEVSAALDATERMGAERLASRIRDLDGRAGLGLTGATSYDRSQILTAREHDVLRELAAGRSNKEIGAALFISAKTASVHVSNILAKLGAASRTEAAAIAHRDGLLR